MVGIFLCLTGIPAFADCGSIPYQSPFELFGDISLEGLGADKDVRFDPMDVVVFEPGQRAIVLWNGVEEILFLSTEIKTSEPRPKYALMTLVAVVFGSATLGWANSQTAFFGLGSLVMMLVLFRTPASVQVFFVRLAGSACCLYAPLEILGEVVKTGGAPSVLGEETSTDVSQLSQYLGIHAAFVAVAILLVQVALLVILVRWTCKAGARQSVRGEIHMHKKKTKLIRDIRPEPRRYTLR